ncbi:hypothetical protein VULLAG_LOCUS8514 [Vulpes lagopus]
MWTLNTFWAPPSQPTEASVNPVTVHGGPFLNSRDNNYSTEQAVPNPVIKSYVPVPDE